MENKHLKFEIDTINVEFLEQKGGDYTLFSGDSQFATAKIRAFSSGWNRHNMYCSEDLLKNTANTIYYKPLLYVLDRVRDDFGSHADPEESRIAGFVVSDSAEFVRLEDGRLSLEVEVKIWKYYAPTLMSIFRRDMGEKKVSVEMELFNYKEREDGVLDMQDFAYMAITILGDAIQEGSPGANIEILSFAEEIEKFESDLLLELSSRYDSIDFEIPENVKNNCQKGLSLYSEHGKADSRSLSNARYLVKNKSIDPKKVKSIYSIFNKSGKFQDMQSEPPSSDYIVYLLNGGKSGAKWVGDIYQKMSDLDQQSLSYFEKITFPYKNVKDANPSLRSWSPPLSLSQMNEIARQADAVEKSGKNRQSAWAIAISNFKKTHKIKDGKWVKKEKMDASLQDDISKEKEVNMKEEKKELEQEVVEESFEKKIKESNMTPEESDDQPYMEAGEDEEGNDKGEEAEDKKSEDEEPEEEMACEKPFSFDVDSILNILSGMKDFKAELSNKSVDLTQVIEKMSSKISELESENESLLEFKSEVDKSNLELEIAGTINYLVSKFEIPEENLKEMREGAENFSLEDIGQWEAQVKVKALDEFPLKNKDAKQGEDVKKYGLPFLRDGEQRKSIWDKYKK